MAKKNPILAAVLNVLIWGLGYLYIGKRTTFGVLLVLGSVLSYSIQLPEVQLEALPLTLFVTIILSIAFAYDAYKEAK